MRPQRNLYLPARSPSAGPLKRPKGPPTSAVAAATASPPLAMPTSATTATRTRTLQACTATLSQPGGVLAQAVSSAARGPAACSSNVPRAPRLASPARLPLLAGSIRSTAAIRGQPGPTQLKGGRDTRIHMPPTLHHTARPRTAMRQQRCTRSRTESLAEQRLTTTTDAVESLSPSATTHTTAMRTAM